MTRINCVPPEELTDKHLLAEYRELPRVFRLAKRRDDIPKTYRMGTGHVLFFYDKLDYLRKRQKEIVAELLRRGFKPNFTNPDDLTNPDPTLFGDWTPTKEAIRINRARIRDRLKLKKD